MGAHRELSRAVLEETDRRSPELIWRYEVQPKLVSSIHRKPTPQ